MIAQAYWKKLTPTNNFQPYNHCRAENNSHPIEHNFYGKKQIEVYLE